MGRSTASRAVFLIASLAAAPASATWTVTQLHSFGSGHDGVYPMGGLIRRDNMFFGTTQQGGRYGYGTVYRLDAVTLKEHVLVNFTGVADGGLPCAGLAYVNGQLYGTAEAGGSTAVAGAQPGYGVIFKVDPVTGQETVLYSFQSGGDGQLPLGGLTYDNGVLYGTTFDGGANGRGTIFSFNLQNSKEAVAYSFAGIGDGFSPLAAPILVDGMLYGTTTAGGRFGFGTVYALDPSTGAENTLTNFADASGIEAYQPQAQLVYRNGTLYGTTAYGGSGLGYGTVYAVNIASGAARIIYNFKGGKTDGANPFGGLIVAPSGLLYGTTQGGLQKVGSTVEALLHTVFVINPVTAAEHVLYDFGGDATGSASYLNQPELLLWGGTLYGSTRQTGVQGCGENMGTGCGSIFQLTPTN